MKIAASARARTAEGIATIYVDASLTAPVRAIRSQRPETPFAHRSRPRT
jgi:hypothetical protein